VTGFFDILLTHILPTKPCKNWLVPSNPEEVGFYNGTGLLVWPTNTCYRACGSAVSSPNAANSLLPF